jgi:hypothetical protein
VGAEVGRDSARLEFQWDDLVGIVRGQLEKLKSGGSRIVARAAEFCEQTG